MLNQTSSQDKRPKETLHYVDRFSPPFVQLLIESKSFGRFTQIRRQRIARPTKATAPSHLPWPIISQLGSFYEFCTRLRRGPTGSRCSSISIGVASISGQRDRQDMQFTIPPKTRPQFEVTILSAFGHESRARFFPERASPKNALLRNPAPAPSGMAAKITTGEKQGFGEARR